MIPSLEKTKYEGKATENVESICSSNEEKKMGTILIGTNPISLNYSTSYLTLSASSNKRKWRKT